MTDLWSRLAGLESPGVLATIVKVTGSAPREPGARLLLLPDGSFEGTLGGGSLEHEILAHARRMLEEGVPSLSRTYRLNPAADQCCGGEVEVFLERVGPAPRVILFGAGHVGQAVARALSPLPFRVTVVDSRPEFAAKERFPDGADVRCGDPLELLGAIPSDSSSTYAFVFTHSHKLDLLLLSVLLGRPLRFLGLIGSRSKWARFREALKSRGFSEADLSRVTSPIGIGVGGKSAPEIAVSVAAQLLAVQAGLTVEVRHLTDSETATSPAEPISAPAEPARRD